MGRVCHNIILNKFVYLKINLKTLASRTIVSFFNCATILFSQYIILRHVVILEKNIYIKPYITNVMLTQYSLVLIHNSFICVCHAHK